MLHSSSLTSTFPEVPWASEVKKVVSAISLWSGSTATSPEALAATQNWQVVGASTVRIAPIEVELLEQWYTFREREKVLWFLEENPFLVSLLLDAYVEVENYFPHSKVFLEVVSDPEVEGWDQLFAYIRTFLPVDQALAQLDKLDEEWFLDQLDQVDDLFNFNLEVV